MKFALTTPGLDNYPAAMAPWEPKASGGAEVVRFARKADELSWDWLTLPEHLIMPTDMAPVWAHASRSSPIRGVVDGQVPDFSGTQGLRSSLHGGGVSDLGGGDAGLELRR